MHNLIKEFKQMWQAEGFQEPTKIQEKAFQAIEEGRSLYLNAPTGSGKTLAYLLPILNRIESGQGLQTIIFAPSQELTMQIAKIAQKWGESLDINVLALAGGANIKRQVEGLSTKPDLVVATPGRFLEILDKFRKLKVHLVITVVYDEADYLLSTEHLEKFEKIRKRLNRDLQSIFVSATVEDDFLKQLQAFGMDVDLIQIDQDQSNLEHSYILSKDRKKIESLRHLGHVKGMLALVFFDQINQLEVAYQRLIYHGIPTIKLHSQLNQIQRQETMNLMLKQQVVFLLTTDLAARGLDFPEIPYVIHYNLADSLETYIHRSGRTGRMGRPGNVVSLVNEQEARDLQNLLSNHHFQVSEKIIYANQIIPPNLKLGQENQENLKAKVPEKATKVQVPKSDAMTKRYQTRQRYKKKNRLTDQKNKGKKNFNK